MDKKRREKKPPDKKGRAVKNECSLYSFLQLTATQEHCGITTKKFKFLESYGNGFFESHYFDGLYIEISDVLFKKNIHTYGVLPPETLELSFLIEGELIITINELKDNLAYESQESYLVYISQVSGNVAYQKRIHYKEVKIRMNRKFIQRYQLDQEYGILDQYALQNLKTNFAQPLCNKTQEILAELLADSRKGVLKRLFLESKILELLTLQLDATTEKKIRTQECHKSY